MEAERRLLKRRKPLTDLTNTHHPHRPPSHSSSSTASVAKPSKPHPSSPFTNLAVSQCKSGARTCFSYSSTTHPDASNPSHLLPVVPTPSRPPNSSWPPGSSNHDASELIPIVYSRRHTSDKRKGKEKAVSVPFSTTPMPKVSSNREKNDEVEGVNLHKAKALSAPCRKKRCTMASKQDGLQHAMLQDFIEKQQGYFKEIDNFELPVEEVESVDELD